MDRDFANQGNRDVYTGMAMLPAKARTQSNQRVKLTDRMAGIAALWIDLDILDPVHAKTNLPPTIEDVIWLAKQMPFQPTIIIHSGHGIQAYWLFEEPWLFENREDQNMAATVVFWWQQKARKICTRNAWEMDSTHALTQLMRMPGFYNLKAEPVLVKVLEDDGPRINRRRMVDMANAEYAEEPPSPRGRATTGSGGTPDAGGNSTFSFEMKADAVPPSEKLQAALENIDRFKDTWDMNRKDMKDTSASAYDMSLASMAVKLDWNNQEIVNLLIAFRRRHGLQPKLRWTYFRKTLQTAREPLEHERNQQELEEALYETKLKEDEAWGPRNEEDEKPSDTPVRENPVMKTDRENLRLKLSAAMGINIRKLVKYLGDPATYWISTDHGNGTLGRITNITNQQNFRNRMADITGKIIDECRGKKAWEARAQALINIREDIALGDASFPREETMEWLDRYLSARGVTDDDATAAVAAGTPFIEKGQVKIILDDFRAWVKFNVELELSRVEMAQRLHQAGATASKVNITVNGKRTSRSCWVVENVGENPDTGGDEEATPPEGTPE